MTLDIDQNKRVLTFGCFDPLHAGHLNFFQQAKSLGSHLIVVVARDDYIRRVKQREPHVSEQARLKHVQNNVMVDEVLLGDPDPSPTDRYRLLGSLEFDIIALGYDQRPVDEIVRHELDKRGKQQVSIVRLKPYQPEKYKSSKSAADND